jgi:spermidine/putrescine transport system permease protein
MNASQTQSKHELRSTIRLGPIVLYMLIFFVIPIGVFFTYSFWTVREWNIVREWNLNNYIDVLTSRVYTRLIFRSIGIGLATAILSILVVYPLAYTMVFKFEKYRDLILFLLAISLFSNYLVRIYAWRSVLSANGLVNFLAMKLGLASEPTHYLLYSQWGVILVLLNVYIPFATLPIYSALLNVERDIIDAASDLGAGPFRTFREITLPLSIPGVIVSFLFIFLLAAGDFVTPELVGGKSGMMIGNAVATQFGMVSNWPLGSAMVFTTIGIFLLMISVFLLLRRGFRKVR